MEDEINKANLGDTLKSAAQMVWDDVNSRMVEALKKIKYSMCVFKIILNAKWEWN